MISFLTSRSKLLVALMLILGVFSLTYYLVPWLFFQQDEWLNSGLILSYGNELLFHRFSSQDLNHWVPFNRLIGNNLFYLFGLDYVYYNVFGLVVHLTNAGLVYSLAGVFFKRQRLAVLASVLFLTSANAAELVMWPVVNISMVALTLSLLIWRLLLNYQNTQRPLQTSMMISLMLFLALTTMEYSAGMIVFIPAMAFLYRNKWGGGKLKLLIGPFLVAVSTYLIFRFYPSQTEVVISGLSWQSYLFKEIQIPFKYIAQIFIPSLITDTLARVLAARLYLLKMMLLAVGLMIVLAGWRLVATKSGDRLVRFYLVSVVLFILANSLPYLFGGSGLSALLAPRYLYFGVAGAAILLVWGLSLATKSIASVVLTLLAVLMITGGVAGNWLRENQLFTQGRDRLMILSRIKASYPVLPAKTVFYITSDTPYYGLPDSERILPFQSGLGQTLLVWYYQSAKFPKEFLKDRFLWGITEQGYQEFNGRGFGYFRDKGLLIQAMAKYQIPLDSVIGFSWSKQTGILLNVTPELRQELAKDRI